MTVQDTHTAAPFVPKLTFADRLRLARRYARLVDPVTGYQVTGMSQEQLAEALSNLRPTKPRIAKGVIGNYEAGSHAPRDLVLFARMVERVTGVDAMWLAGFPRPAGEDETMFRCTLLPRPRRHITAGQPRAKPPYPRPRQSGGREDDRT